MMKGKLHLNFLCMNHYEFPIFIHFPRFTSLFLSLIEICGAQVSKISPLGSTLKYCQDFCKFTISMKMKFKFNGFFSPTLHLQNLKNRWRLFCQTKANFKRKVDFSHIFKFKRILGKCKTLPTAIFKFISVIEKCYNKLPSVGVSLPILTSDS